MPAANLHQKYPAAGCPILQNVPGSDSFRRLGKWGQNRLSAAPDSRWAAKDQTRDQRWMVGMTLVRQDQCRCGFAIVQGKAAPPRDGHRPPLQLSSPLK